MFKNKGLAIKQAIGFGIIILALVFVAIFSYEKITNVQVTVNDLTEVHIPLFNAASKIDVLTTEQELAVANYTIHKEEEFIKYFNEVNNDVDKTFEHVKDIIKTDTELIEMGWMDPVTKMEKLHDVFVEEAYSLISAVKSGLEETKVDHLADRVMKNAGKLMDHVDEFLEMNNKETNVIAELANATAINTKKTISIISILTIITGIFLALIIIRSITRSINDVITGLTTGSNQVTAASAQVSQSSQQLAEGASEQAASLEEISSSLEEMSSMITQNASNTKSANKMAEEAKTSSENGTRAMSKMGKAINDIKKSSDETAKIIKTIDEIAFQTNLLALNAAVEAARAGEAGKGFAVVAEEVRNLAQRSAEAAKNTSALIEGAQKNAENGVGSSNEVAEILRNISDKVQKFSQIISQVSAASQEQAQGIEQINTAVTQMDSVTQSNASNAEESASASEELSGQANELKQMVNVLISVVKGTMKANNTNYPSQGHNNYPDYGNNGNGKKPSIRNYKRGQIPAPISTRVVKPKEAIQLEAKDLADF